ncbi:MAG TPA: hypothetical protein VEH04_07590 [Verrucomicrobiae bacterium]|nr:hypothetical protein [Verrucomicrobiae bacterium]
MIILKTWSAVILAAFLICGSSILSGCMSKSAAQAHARAAYLAGQRDAIAQLNQQQPSDTTQSVVPNLPSNVTFIGPVEHPVVAWRTGLTLAQAILGAVYQSDLDPVMILIRRSNEEIRIEPSRLLNGTDIPLRPGDIVFIQMPAE